MRETDNSQPVNPEVAERIFEIRRRVDKLLPGLLAAIWDELAEKSEKAHIEGYDPRHDFLASAQHRTANLIPEADTKDNPQITTAFGELAKSAESDKARLLSQTSDTIISLMATHLTLQELETRLRDDRPADQDPLSRALECRVEDNQIRLAIQVTFFENEKQAIASLIEGFKVLAKKMLTEPKYQTATEVVGNSELVKEKPRLFSRPEYGFTVTRDESGRPTDEIKIAREKFLSIYGQ